MRKLPPAPAVSGLPIIGTVISTLFTVPARKRLALRRLGSVDAILTGLFPFEQYNQCSRNQQHGSQAIVNKQTRQSNSHMALNRRPCAEQENTRVKNQRQKRVND